MPEFKDNCIGNNMRNLPFSSRYFLFYFQSTDLLLEELVAKGSFENTQCLKICCRQKEKIDASNVSLIVFRSNLFNYKTRRTIYEFKTSNSYERQHGCADTL